MNVTKPLFASAVLVAAMLGASAWAWPHLPDVVAVHWGLDGAPNGYATRFVAVMIGPILAAGLALFFTVMPQVMPAKGRLERSAGAYSVAWLATMLLIAAAHALILAKALRLDIDVAHAAGFMIAALLAVIGNVLGKVRYNYVFGVRTPWTLASERVWDRTHRFAGWAMVLAGLSIAAIGVLTPASAQGDHGLLLGVTACAVAPTLMAAVYSYWLSRKADLAA